MNIPREHIDAIVNKLVEWSQVTGSDADVFRHDLYDEFTERKREDLDDPRDNKLGQWRKGDPGTSRKAAVSVFPRSGSQRFQVIKAISNGNPDGMITFEISEATGIRIQSVSPRIGELKNGGWIQASGRTRKSPVGAEQDVLVLTEKTINWIKQEKI